MNEHQQRRQLMEDRGMTWEEAEDELDNRASDAYDRRREEDIKLWADEWANNVRDWVTNQGEKMKGETK